MPTYSVRYLETLWSVGYEGAYGWNEVAAFPDEESATAERNYRNGVSTPVPPQPVDFSPVVLEEVETNPEMETVTADSSGPTDESNQSTSCGDKLGGMR